MKLNLSNTKNHQEPILNIRISCIQIKNNNIHISISVQVMEMAKIEMNMMITIVLQLHHISVPWIRVHDLDHAQVLELLRNEALPLMLQTNYNAIQFL